MPSRLALGWWAAAAAMIVAGCASSGSPTDGGTTSARGVQSKTLTPAATSALAWVATHHGRQGVPKDGWIAYKFSWAGPWPWPWREHYAVVGCYGEGEDNVPYVNFNAGSFWFPDGYSPRPVDQFYFDGPASSITTKPGVERQWAMRATALCPPTGG